MSRFCSECGEKINDENAAFCEKCGARINSEKKNYKPIILILIVIIAVMIVIGLSMTGFDLSGKAKPTLSIMSQSPVSNSENFTVQLTNNNQAISGKEIKITFKHDSNSSTFSAFTDSSGQASIIPNVEQGEYEVTCEFEGDDEYAKSSISNTFSVETKITELESQVTSSRTEPDYQSFSYSHSFEDTDTNGDGYVLLSDMNIAHTPKNIQNQMFADSDSNGDGRLNHDEYYKFMYKLNYDKSSYGL